MNRKQRRAKQRQATGSPPTSDATAQQAMIERLAQMSAETRAVRETIARKRVEIGLATSRLVAADAFLAVIAPGKTP